MGNKQESNNVKLGKFIMEIILNKFTFFPGELIKGEIKLSLRDEDSEKSQKINNIKFYFALIHKECWQKFDNVESKDKDKDKDKSNENTIDDLSDQPLDNFKQNIIFAKKEIYNDLNNKEEKDILTIPFQIKIPSESKHSFEFTNGNKLYGYSRIYLDIEIPDALNKKEILIFIEKPPTPLDSQLTISKYITKKKLGFIGSGSHINFQGSYPKNNYGFGEKCPLNVLLDIFGANEAIKGISLTLKRKILFMKNYSKGGEEYIEDLWLHNLKDSNLNKSINFSIPLLETSKIINERKTSFFDINSISKEKLICLLPSYEGQLIKCQYYILIKIFYESILIKNPEFEMPIDLGHSQSVFNQIFIIDVNKVLTKVNETIITNLMNPDFSGTNNNNILGNKNQIETKSKMKDIFGDKNTLQKSKTKKENMSKIFGATPKSNNKPTNNDNNNKVQTPMFGKSTNINNINNISNININNSNDSKQKLGNSSGSLGSSGSSNLPNKSAIYTAKDEQAAPGVKKP